MLKFKTLLNDALAVVNRPAIFYREMAADGGYCKPTAFVVITAIAVALVQALAMMFSNGIFGGISTLAVALVVTPIYALILLIASSVLLFVVAKLLGSNRSFEASYRALAFAAGVVALIVILDRMISWFWVVGIVWVWWLLTTIAVEVHGLQKFKAMIAITIILGLLTVVFDCPRHDRDQQFEPETLLLKKQPQYDRELNQGTVDANDDDRNGAIVPAWAEEGINNEGATLPKTGEALDALVEEFEIFTSTMAAEVKNAVSAFAEGAESFLDKSLDRDETFSDAKREKIDSTAPSIAADSNSDKEQGSDMPSRQPTDESRSAAVFNAEKLGQVVGNLVNALNRTADQLNQGFVSGLEGSDPAEIETVVQDLAEKTGETIGLLIQAFENAAKDIDKALVDTTNDTSQSTPTESKISTDAVEK